MSLGFLTAQRKSSNCVILFYLGTNDFKSLSNSQFWIGKAQLDIIGLSHCLGKYNFMLLNGFRYSISFSFSKVVNKFSRARNLRSFSNEKTNPERLHNICVTYVLNCLFDNSSEPCRTLVWACFFQVSAVVSYRLMDCWHLFITSVYKTISKRQVHSYQDSLALSHFWCLN